MKKAIHSQLNELADELPVIFEEHPDVVLMTGEELKLTPYGDQFQLVPDKLYEVPIPKYVAVQHKQQVKDAFKRSGMEGVNKYVNKVLTMFQTSEKRQLITQ